MKRAVHGVAALLFAIIFAPPLFAQQPEVKAPAAAKWSDDELDSALRKYLFDVREETDSTADRDALRSVRERVVPRVLKTLADPAGRGRLITPIGRGSAGLPETPFNRACALLSYDSAPPSEFVPLLAGFLDVPERQVRKDAAGLLAEIGAAETIPALKKVLHDGDDFVRTRAMLGLSFALQAKRLDPRVRNELFDDLRQCLTARHGADRTAELMFKFDRDRTVETLTAPDVLTVDHPNLADILAVLKLEKIDVARDRLIPLVETLERRDLKVFGNAYALGSALTLLGRHRDPRDRERIERYASSTNPPLAVHSLIALTAWHGLEDVRARIDAIVSEKGLDGLNSEQRRYHAVVHFDEAVNGSGILAWFQSAEGDRWKELLAALEALGLKDRAEILSRAVKLFPDGTPAPDRAERSKQAVALEEPLLKIETDYYRLTSNLEVLLMRYVLEHQDAFR